MASTFQVITSTAAGNEISAIAEWVADAYGYVYGERVEVRLLKAIKDLGEMPGRHPRLRQLIGRRYVYRRVLVNKHRIIFVIDEVRLVVEVVRVDLQSANPATLDDLP